MKLIRTTGVFPPGGYAFRDHITGKNYTDTHTTFDQRVNEIIRDRSANSRLFTDQKLVAFDDVSNELSHQICERIGGDPNWCTDGNPVRQPTPVVASGKNCPKCSAAMIAELCKTCSGNKITGYKCSACGSWSNP